MTKVKKIRLHIRQAKLADIQALVKLSSTVYGIHQFTAEMLQGQISAFPEGQFVAEYNGKIVGHCATFITTGEAALKPHKWGQITGHGYAARHLPTGDYLYGMEICVDPSYRRLRIGQRLYDARKRLCEDLGLKGIVFGGRMPNYAKRKMRDYSPEEYVRLVVENVLRDPVINFQLRQGFEVIGLLDAYLPLSEAPEGVATHMLWTNHAYQGERDGAKGQRGRTKDSVRIAAVQYQARKVDSFEAFAKHVEYFVDVAADYKADFVLFPELLTIPLSSIDSSPMTPRESIEKITAYTDDYVRTLQQFAISYNINIIGGSHPTRVDAERIENWAYVFLRDGSIHTQPKLHPTPNERYWWNIKGGDRLKAIPTDCGPIGVLVCYDAEFPEAARHLADQGAQILFVPFCTDERQGYLRVRYCAQARAVENQMYVAAAGIVGNLPDVENMDVHYAESCILTPCDFPFARDGIAATSTPNTEMLVMADLSMESLHLSRHSGTVQNLKDRRFDLYQVAWSKKG